MASAAIAGLGWAVPSWSWAWSGIDGITPDGNDAPATEAPPEPGPTTPAAQQAFDPVVALARAELARLADQIPNHDLVGIADYSLPSHEPRFHLVDPGAGRVLDTLLVAHGRGSDPQHSGRVQRFSNEVGSNASSEGAYRTGELYVGMYGRSIRLDGLDATNNNAEVRAIVVHSAPYVSAAVVQSQGKLGRSEGCFVFAGDDYEMVLERLGPGRLLVAAML